MMTIGPILNMTMQIGITFQIPDHRSADTVKFTLHDPLRIFHTRRDKNFTITLGQLFFGSPALRNIPKSGHPDRFIHIPGIAAFNFNGKGCAVFSLGHDLVRAGIAVSDQSALIAGPVGTRCVS